MDDDGCSAASKFQGNRPADAAAGARDGGRLAGKGKRAI
jgi:hypothetical protein